MQVECEVIGEPSREGNQVRFRARDTQTMEEFECLTPHHFDDVNEVLRRVREWKTERFEGSFSGQVFYIRELLK